MTRVIWFGSLVTIIGALTFANMSEPAAAAACARKTFETKLIAEACSKGGQKAAKDAMKAFNKQHKIKSCNQCHSKLAPSYELKPDGLEQFQKLGGK